MEAISEVYRKSTKWITFLSGGIFVVIFVLSKDILSLFGSEFTQGEAALRVFAVGQLVNACVGPTNYTLLMFKRRIIILFNSFLNAILSILFMLYLLPKFGVIGGALAISLSIGIVNMISLWEVIYFLKVIPGSITAMTLRLVPIVATIFILMGFKDIFIGFNMIGRLSLNLLLCTFCYISLLYLGEKVNNIGNNTFSQIN